MDERFADHIAEQTDARHQDLQSGDPGAFLRHLARIRQRPDGSFEHRAPDGAWYAYLPGGYPYGAREVEALRARGDTITAENVLIQ